MTSLNPPWPLISPLVICACFAPYATPLPEEGSSSSSDDESESSGFTATDSNEESGSAPPPEEPWCGDGVVDTSEICDDGVNDGSYGGCQPGCSSLAPHCGDGVTQGDEACDDGNTYNGDGCNRDCIHSGTQLWSTYFDATETLSDDNAVGLSILRDDAIVVVSSTYPQGETHLRRFSSDGLAQWSRPIALTHPVPWSIAPFDDERVVVVGSTEAQPSAWISLMSTRGEPEWTDSLDSIPRFYDVASPNDGSVVVVGHGLETTVLRRYGEFGHVLWTDVLPFVLSLPSIDGTSDGGAIISGSSSLEDYALWLRRLSDSNQELWTRVAPNLRGNNDISVAADGTIVVCGTDWGASEGWTASFNSDGALQWSTPHVSNDPTGWVDLLAIAAIPEGGAFAVGHISAPNQGVASDILILRLSNSGAIQWERTISSPFVPEGTAYQQAQAVEVDSAGNAVVAGYIQTDDGADTWVAKFAP